MEPNIETLRLIRQITADGVVTDDEVMSLANHLNDNSAARKSWPGNVIFEVLKRVFDDARVDPHELKSLSHILRGIELQCCGASGEGEDNEIDDISPRATFEEINFALPLLDLQIQVAAHGKDAPLSDVDLSIHECSCGDWNNRRFSFPEESPGRACRCIVMALHKPEIESEIPRFEWNNKLFQLLDHFSECGTSFDPVPSWKLLRHSGREWVVAWGDGMWAMVYTENRESQIERFCYQIYSDRWAYGAKPAGATAIAHYLRGDHVKESDTAKSRFASIQDAKAV